ncbi:MAG: PAS domain S-box protein, partial [Candidatus Kariarchaeaceae archaeon]
MTEDPSFSGLDNLNLNEVYKLIAEKGYDAIAITERGKLIHVNYIFTQMFGYKVSEVVGSEPFKFMTPDSVELVKRRIEEKYALPYEYTSLRKDGTTFPTEVWGRNFVLDDRELRIVIIRDISDRKQSEKALAESEERYRQLFESSSIAMWEVDFFDTVNYLEELEFRNMKDFREYMETNPEVVTKCFTKLKLKRVNQKSVELYEADNKKHLLDNIQKILIDDATNAFKEGLLAIQEGKLTLNIEIPQKTLKGKLRLFSFHFSVVPAVENPYSQVVLSILDITDITRAHDALKESEGRYRTLFDSAPLGILVMQDAICQFVNPAFVTMFGYDSAKEIIGLAGTELLSPDVRKKLKERTLRRQEGEKEPTSYDSFGLRKNGEIFPMHLEVSRINFEGQPSILVFYEDITDKKQIENELITSQALYQDLYDNAPDMFVSVDAKTAKIINCNNTLAHNLGYSKEELIGQLVFYVYHPNSLDKANLVFEKFVKTGEVKNEEMQLKLKDGSPLDVSLNVSAVYDEDGNIIHSRSVWRDITARKKAEAALKESQEQLYQAKKLESLGVLAGGIAHDFNNILMGILNYSNLASIELPFDSPLQGYLEQIEESTQRASTLSKQMLSLSGKGRLIINTWDVTAIIKEASQLLIKNIPMSIQFSMELSDNQVPVECDKTQVKQIINNLVTNSVEAIEESDGNIKISNGMIVIDNDYDFDFILGDKLSNGKYAYFEVADSGKGIEEEDMSKIFDPFHTTKFVGRGLGLPVTLGIVRSHGGAINLQSKVDEGTVIRVILPYSDKPLEMEKEEIVPIKKKAGKTILVCDDEQVVRNVIGEILQHNGYDVLIAVDGID